MGVLLKSNLFSPRYHSIVYPSSSGNNDKGFSIFSPFFTFCSAFFSPQINVTVISSCVGVVFSFHTALIVRSLLTTKVSPGL